MSVRLPKVRQIKDKYSKKQLIIFALVFAAIGTYLLWHSFAATQAVASVEAEQMTLPAGATIYSDVNASGGKAVQFANNGSATSSLTIPTGSSASSLTVSAHGNKCHGWPTMSVVVDGTTVMSATSISASGWTKYSVPVNLISGSHTLKLTAGNTATKPNCSRNLYIDVSTLYGTATPPAPTLAFSASPTSVSAGGSSALTWTTTNATGCTASGAWSGSEPTAGSVSTGAINSTATYGLNCSGSGGSASASVTVSVAAATPTPTPSGTTVWSGDFETGDLSQWSLNQSCPAGVTIVTNPLRSGKYAAAFTVTDQSTNAYCSAVPTSNPRAQLVGPGLFHNGDEYYIGFSTYFPSNFPTITSWFQFAEIYGPPYGGSPPMGFDVSGNRLTMDRDPTHNWDTIWTSPSDITKGTAWEDIIVHIKFSTDPSVGFVELWLNGVPQKFTNGSTRIYYDTLVPNVNWDGSTPNHLYLNQYRSTSVSLGSVTIWHDAARVGTSYSSVAP